MSRNESESGLQALAAAAQRRNRPTALLVVASVTFVVALIFALYAAGNARKAYKSAQSQAQSLQKIEEGVALLNAISTDTDQHDLLRLYRPAPRLLTTLENINQTLAIEPKPDVREQTKRAIIGLDSPIEGRVVTAQFNNVSLQQATQWINEALRRVNGLHVSSVDFRPSARGWIIRVDLTRWELKQK